MFNVILKSLLKRKLLNVFIIVQLTITSMFLFSIFTRTNSYNYVINQLKSKKIDRANVVHVKFYNRIKSKEAVEDFNGLKDYILSIDGVGGCGSYDFTGVSLNRTLHNEEFEKVRKSLYKDSKYGDVSGRVEAVNVDYDIYELMNLEIIQGRALTKEGFNLKTEDIIPILVGSKFKDVVKINDTFKSDENTYRVVGILKEGSSWLNKSQYYGNLLKSLDDKIVLGFTEKQNHSLPYIGVRSQNLFYINRNNKELNKTRKLVEAKMEQLKFRGECKTMDEEINNYKEENKETLKMDFIFMSLLTILSCSGITTTILSSIIIRKREFGIRIAAGSSINDLKKMILLELYSLGIVSTIIATIKTLIDNYQDNKYLKMVGCGVNPMNNISVEIIILSVVLVLIIITFTSIIPLNRLEKFSPKELIGGID